jgi:hypothetical protein
VYMAYIYTGPKKIPKLQPQLQGPSVRRLSLPELLPPEGPSALESAAAQAKCISKQALYRLYS